MAEPLKLGIPDDEAATAPSRKFKSTDRKSAWLSRLLVPLSLGIWGYFANKLVASEVKKTPADEPVFNRVPIDDEEKEAGITPVKSVPDHVPTHSETGLSNIVNFSDHPITAASRSSKSVMEMGESINIESLVAGLGKDLDKEREVDTSVASAEFTFSDSAPKSVNNSTKSKVEETQDAPKRSENAPTLGTLRTNETMVLTTAMLLAYAPELDGDFLEVLNFQSESGTITSVGEDMWLYVPNEGFEGEAKISFDATDGVTTLQRDLTVSYEDSVEDVVGTIDADHFVTTPESEDILLRDGDDAVYARDGNDIVLGHAGDDRLIGGEGNDTLYGGDGDDYLFGREGDDVLLGGEGNDTVYGGEGDDIALGGSGHDFLQGDKGNDQLAGGEGGDTLLGGEGADYMDGGAGDDEFRIDRTEFAGDVVQGGEGLDTLVFTSSRAGAKIDLKRGSIEVDGDTASISDIENIFADLGDDELTASDASNIFSGGGGQDRFVFEDIASLSNRGHARDLILDFDVGDRIDLSKLNDQLGSLIGINLQFAGFGASNGLAMLSYYFEGREDGGHRTVVSAKYRDDECDDDDEDSNYLAFEIDGQIELERSNFFLTLDDLQA